MQAEILSIGTEILFGQIVDTNSAWIATHLPALGIDLYFISTVGDNKARIAETFKRAWDRSDLIITTGGLGPTEDDMTREAIAEMLGEELYIDPDLAEALRERSRRRGTPFVERTIKQANLIKSAKAITNARGSAPGWWVEKDGHIIVSMPGVRSEMFGMWENEVEPKLLERSDGTMILSRNFKTTGLGEPLVDEMMGDLLHSDNPSIGVYAKLDGVHIRLSAKAKSQSEANRLLDQVEPQIRERLGNALWGEETDTPASSVAKLLTNQGLTLAAMESCTGGLLASTITDLGGSSDYFKGSIVSYTNDVKVKFGVDPRIIEEHGVISAETATAMAVAVREQLGADIGLGITGVAGSEPVEGKAPGTVYFGVATAEYQKATVNGIYLPYRPDIKERAVANALLYIRRCLMGME